MTQLPARRNRPVLTPKQIKAAQYLARADNEAQAKLQAVKDKLASARKVDELLGDPLVLQEAERILMQEQAPLRRIRVMKQLENIAFADISDLFAVTRAGRLVTKPLKDMTPAQRALISSLRITNTSFG